MKFNKDCKPLNNPNSWRKGLTKDTDKRIMNISKGLMGHKFSEETKKKISDTLKIKFKTGELKVWCKGKKLGFDVWNKGKKGIYSKEYIKKLSDSHKGIIPSVETRNKMSKIMKKIWENEDYSKKVLGRREKSSLEIKFEKIAMKNNLPYIFVGNGNFFIGKKCPDFINVNGKKIAIEVFYTKHKEKFVNGGFNMWKKNRTELFRKYGWEIEYFNETQVNKEIILRRLG